MIVGGKVETQMAKDQFKFRAADRVKGKEEKEIKKMERKLGGLALGGEKP